MPGATELVSPFECGSYACEHLGFTLGAQAHTIIFLKREMARRKGRNGDRFGRRMPQHREMAGHGEQQFHQSGQSGRDQGLHVGAAQENSAAKGPTRSMNFQR